MRSVWRRTGAVLGLVFILGALIVPAASAAPVQAPAPAPAQAPVAQGQVVYWVQPGDSWFGIGARFGVSAWSIAAANGMSIYSVIYPGQRLIIPFGAPVPTGCGTCGQSAIYYTVRRGDTLATIGARFGVSYWTIAQLNGITNVNRIYAGRVLLIRPAVPCTQPCPPAPPPPCPNCVPVPVPQPGGYIGPWTGDYFATPDLSGNITVKQLDSAVNFNWGWNPPAPGMPNFNWSARWTRFENNMAGGVYRANVCSDDGARVYVDGVRIIDAWVVQALHCYTQDFSIVPGNHTLVIEYFQAQGVAELHFQLWKVG